MENIQTFIAHSISSHYHYTKYSVIRKQLHLSRFIDTPTGYTIEDKHAEEVIL